MSRIIRDAIYYDGISDYIPSDINCYTYKSIDKIITLKEDLPSIDEIINVKVIYNLKDKKVVKTATGTSLEGQVLTGLKLLSEGEFVIRIDYSNEELNGCIYTVKEKIYFNNAVDLNLSYSINSRIVENIYIEDIYVEKNNERELIANISYIFAIEDY